MKTYSELIMLPTFEERFEYLKLNGRVGEDTFGYDRYLNQIFYTTKEWRDFRDRIIFRDNGCDLGMPDRQIFGRIYIHHIVPLTKEDLLNRNDCLLNPENVICVSYDTHNAIHYGDATKLPSDPIIRTKNDTCPWRH